MTNINENINDQFPINFLQSQEQVGVFNGQSLLKSWKNSKLQNHMWFFPFSSACCSLAYQVDQNLIVDDGTNPLFKEDISEVNANILVFSGMITPKLVPYLRKVYQKMSYPKWVVAVGTCAISGAPFEGPFVMKGLELLFPVDIVIPGCPPSEEGIDLGLKLLGEKMKKGICSAIQVNSEVGLKQ